MWKAIDYEDEYFDKMVEMVHENYGDVEIANPEFLRWQYFDNPAGKAIINFAYDDDKEVLAGQYVCVPICTQMGHATKNAAYALDILTKEKYRGQRIFSKLGELNYKKCFEGRYEFGRT